jgi:hypothetical protein
MTQTANFHPYERKTNIRATAMHWPRWALFVAIGLLLYGAAYVGAESLVYRTGEKNRFFMIAASPARTYDFVILGASHAMPLGFEDVNERLEEQSGASIINLSNEGAGILPNRLILDYFLCRHKARNVIYVLDSFAFQSRKWNEERVHDVGLFKRAPFDMDLVRVLWDHGWARAMLPDYVSGFSKINNPARFERDVPDAERNKFNRTYRPNPKIDALRISYLYALDENPKAFEKYIAEFEALAERVKSAGAKLIVIKPPTPARYRDKLPDEAAFDRTITTLLAKHGTAFHDFSTAITGDAYFYDTDHLNRGGVIAFSDDYLAPFLKNASQMRNATP